jgi:ABC-type uncharacterized transport system permease subunit
MFFCFVLSSAHLVSETAWGHQLIVVARHHLADAHLVLPMHVAPPKVLVGATVTALTGGHAVAVASEVLQVVLVQHRFVFNSTAYHAVAIFCGLALVEVLRRAGCRKH